MRPLVRYRSTSALRPFVLGIVLAAVAGCVDRSPQVRITGPAFSRAAPAATFDWTMPARFGLDTDADGLMDYPRTPEQIDPSSWTVDFDACDVPTGATSTEYDWFVNNALVASVPTCKYSHRFPALGRYNVSLHVIRVPGPGVWAQQMVTVQDWLIVSFGDSYASGEGVPEVQSASDAVIQQIQNAMTDLVQANQDLAAAEASLQAAIEQKGLADSVLTDAQNQLNALTNACASTNSTVATCAAFLANLPYATYQDAQSAFTIAVNNAQASVQSAIQAVNEAQAAVGAAQNAVANLQATINTLRAGLKPAKWQPDYPMQAFRQNNCHRSANAAPARAALAIEEADPKTSVTFVQMACSGAQIDVHPGNLHDQIRLANELIGNREIDAAIISIGGNDAGFSSLATSCVVQQPCYSSDPAFDPHDAESVCNVLAYVGFGSPCDSVFSKLPDSSAAVLLSAHLSQLPAKYDTLADLLLPTLTGLLAPLPANGPPGSTSDALARLRANRVYITQYPDLTKDDQGNYCRFDPANLLGTLPGVSVDETQWLDQTATQSIDGAVASAAAAHGWNFVGGIYQAYRDHGYCAQDHWVNRIYETLLRQGDMDGLMHPDNEGQAASARVITAALIADLYPDGLSGPPRPPDGPAPPPLVP